MAQGHPSRSELPALAPNPSSGHLTCGSTPPPVGTAGSSSAPTTDRSPPTSGRIPLRMQEYLLEARQMQALSLGVHIPLVCFGIAFPAMVLFCEGLWLRTGDPAYKAL